MARPWSARCYGVARQREGSRHNSIGGPAFTLSITLSAREGADGQAVVCPLLRGSSPTRWVAPKQHRGPPRLPYLSPLARARALMARAVVCPLLRGSSPTGGVARKRQGDPAFPYLVTLSARGMAGQRPLRSY